MKCYRIRAWENDKHWHSFFILVDGHYNEMLDFVLDIIRDSSKIKYFEIFDGDIMVIDETVNSSTESIKKEE